MKGKKDNLIGKRFGRLIVVSIEGRDKNRRIFGPQQVTKKELSQLVNQWSFANRYLLQQGLQLYLKNGRVHDFRVLIQKNGNGAWEVTGGAGRIGADRSITSNLHGGGEAVPMMPLLVIVSCRSLL